MHRYPSIERPLTINGCTLRNRIFRSAHGTLLAMREGGVINDELIAYHIARARGGVVHGAPYVTATRAGRSEGCPALEPARARRLIPQIATGALVFLYSPRASDWLSTDRWVRDDDAT